MGDHVDVAFDAQQCNFLWRHRGNTDSEPFSTGALRLSGTSVHFFVSNLLVILSSHLPIMECWGTTEVERHNKENQKHQK